jgi:hypothetical protein
MFTLDGQKQLQNEEDVSGQNLSHSEELDDAPYAPAPGIENLLVSDLGREFNPNTE